MPSWRIAAAVGLLMAVVWLWSRPQPQPADFGYTPDPEGVEEFLAELERPLFAQAGADAIAKAKGVDTFLYRPLYKAHLERYGSPFVVGNQGIGDCTSWGWMHGIYIAQSVDYELGKLEAPPLMPATEPIYGGSRCQARNRDFAGFSDGSYGAACARWCRDWGVVYREPDVCGFDLTAYSASLAKNWGAYGAGGKSGRDCVNQQAKKHPAQHVALVRTWEECAAAIESGYPVVVCCMLGFSSRRDDQGFAVPEGNSTTRWAHCQVLIATRWKKNGSPRDGALCLNSWGPRWNGGGKWPEDMPDGSYWINATTVDRMLSAGDSFAVGSISGFDFRNLHHGGWLMPAPEDLANQ